MCVRFVVAAVTVESDVAGEGDENELANFTPAFLWLLRDFYLTLEEDGRQARPHIPLSPQPRKHISCSFGSAGCGMCNYHSAQCR